MRNFVISMIACTPDLAAPTEEINHINRRSGQNMHEISPVFDFQGHILIQSIVKTIGV